MSRDLVPSHVSLHGVVASVQVISTPLLISYIVTGGSMARKQVGLSKRPSILLSQRTITLEEQHHIVISFVKLERDKDHVACLSAADLTVRYLAAMVNAMEALFTVNDVFGIQTTWGMLLLGRYHSIETHLRHTEKLCTSSGIIVGPLFLFVGVLRDPSVLLDVGKCRRAAFAV